MIPAQQRLAGRDPPGLEIDQRLVEQFEFLVGQRLAQIQFQDAAGLDGLRHLVAEEAEGAAAVGLGAIQRHVGVLQQRVGADAAATVIAMPMLAPISTRWLSIS